MSKTVIAFQVGDENHRFVMDSLLPKKAFVHELRYIDALGGVSWHQQDPHHWGVSEWVQIAVLEKLIVLSPNQVVERGEYRLIDLGLIVIKPL